MPAQISKTNRFEHVTLNRFEQPVKKKDWEEPKTRSFYRGVMPALCALFPGDRAAHNLVTVKALQAIEAGVDPLPGIGDAPTTTLPAARLALLPRDVQRLVQCHFAPDIAGNFAVYKTGLGELSLADYVNFTNDPMAANIKEVTEGEADELCYYETTRALAKGEELLLLREDPPQQYDASTEAEVDALVQRLAPQNQ